ncbi:MAG: glycosyltransferase family 2 protein [Polyangiaceae bacterium]|nr:glycosyltransferase family 2 protein [Polyangiaceae bacterium]
MWKNQRIAVVIPAYCEEALLDATLSTIPAFVDRIYVVDDASPDGTFAVAERCSDPRVHPLRHRNNRGVGGAIITGYQRALSDGYDVFCVMAGDNQMHPDDLIPLVDKLITDRLDYVKGNRFNHPDRKRMPAARRLGGRALGQLTSWASGTKITDSQCGYTAMSARCAADIDLFDIWPRYGYPNDLLMVLTARGARVGEVSVRPVYANEQSGLRPWHTAAIAMLIGRRWWALRQERRASPSRFSAPFSPRIG